MSKTRDTGFLANVIQVHDTGVRIMSGSEMLMAISSSGQVTITGELSGSDAANSLLLDGTGSLAFTTTASYNAFSASYGIASASLSSRTTQVERTYATTGSNTFTGPQYISNTSNAIGFTSTASLYSDGGLRVQGNSFVSGTAYFNNIVVYGTSSVQYITSSQVNIGSNIITVNTDTPAIRFGGLSVFDSGSTGLTGSILWDSEKNHWVYSNPSGSTYSGGMFISGPRSSALGSEQGTTSCMLLVGQGGDHLTSSMIYHDSARTCFHGNALFVSSSCSVGIGTNIPRGVFDVRVASDRGIVVTGTVSSETVISGMQGDVSANLRNLRIAGNNLSFNTGDGTNSTGIERITITSAGCVGIGTVSPSYRLEICGDGNGTGELAVKGTGTDIGLALNNTGTGGKAWRILSTSGGSGAGNGKLLTWDGTGYGWVMDNCRNMGIGTTTVDSYPNYTTLQVGCTNGIIQTYDGTVKTAIVSNSQGAGLMGTRTNHDLRIVSNDTERIRVTCGGNTCVYCQLSVGPVVVIGNQGGTDTTVLTGGSGQGSALRMNYAGGSYNNLLAGNGDNYFNCLLGKLNAAGGVKFGAGSSTLNYYEAGTWTPQLYWTGGGYYAMGGINGGNYVRVGNLVHLNFQLQWSSRCSGGSFSGNLNVGGVPFTNGAYRSAGPVSAISSGVAASSAAYTWLAYTIDPGATFIYLIQQGQYSGYSHTPATSDSGLIYSSTITYAIQ